MCVPPFHFHTQSEKHLKIHDFHALHFLTVSLPCTTVYDASTEDRLVMTVTSSSLLELSMSMLIERSISRWRLVTMPVGYVTLVRRPSLSYLGERETEMRVTVKEEGNCKICMLVHTHAQNKL